MQNESVKGVVPKVTIGFSRFMTESTKFFKSAIVTLVLKLPEVIEFYQECRGSKMEISFDHKPLHKLVYSEGSTAFRGTIALGGLNAKTVEITSFGESKLVFQDSHVSSLKAQTNIKELQLIDSRVNYLRSEFLAENTKGIWKRLTIYGSGSKPSYVGNMSLINLDIDEILLRGYVRRIYWEKLEINSLDVRNVDLRNSHMILLKCEVEKMNWLAVDWPKEYGKYQNKPGEARVTVSLLKSFAHKLNDEIAYKIFSVVDREAHYYHLKRNGATIFNTGEFASLSLSRHTNDFGRSWSWSLIWIISSAYFFLELIMITQGIHDFPHNGWDILNPLHESYVVSHGFNKGWAYFFEGVHRVVHGTLIFQFLKAFRYHVT